MSEFFDGIVVCNTGPLIGLSRAGLCHLIGPLFSNLKGIFYRSKTQGGMPASRWRIAGLSETGGNLSLLLRYRCGWQLGYSGEAQFDSLLVFTDEMFASLDEGEAIYP